MTALAKRFPLAEAAIRDRIDDLIVPSEPAVQTTVEEDPEHHFWVTISCAMAEFSSKAAFAPDDLGAAAGAWPFWCDRVTEELGRRLRERGRSGW